MRDWDFKRLTKLPKVREPINRKNEIQICAGMTLTCATSILSLKHTLGKCTVLFSFFKQLPETWSFWCEKQWIGDGVA